MTKGLSEERVAEIRATATTLKADYGNAYLLENDLIDGCLELADSYTALAARLKSLTEKYQVLVAFYDKHAGCVMRKIPLPPPTP